MSVALITTVLAQLAPLLGGTALGGVLSIATPTRIRRIIRIARIITSLKPAYTPEERAIAAAHMARRRTNPLARWR